VTTAAQGRGCTSTAAAAAAEGCGLSGAIAATGAAAAAAAAKGCVWQQLQLLYCDNIIGCMGAIVTWICCTWGLCGCLAAAMNAAMAAAMNTTMNAVAMNAAAMHVSQSCDADAADALQQHHPVSRLQVQHTQQTQSWVSARQALL
jgi:hypothetical protein